MTLHEAIVKVLKENNRPLTAKVITTIINKYGYYLREDLEPLKSQQVLARVKNYPSLFQTINGNIILVEHEEWKNLLTSYWYLVNLLKGIFSISDVQFIIAVLLYYKRLLDINGRSGHEPHFGFDAELQASIASIIDGGRFLSSGLESLESLEIAPQGVFLECSRLVSKLERHKLIEIWSVVKQINTVKLKNKDFGNIFEYFLTLDSIDGYRSSINHTPFSLRDLMVGLLNPEDGKSIFDPVAGTGGLLIHSVLDSYIPSYETKGFEINKRIAQLGNMNLKMHGLNWVNINPKDCFEDINEPVQYDYIIADLPFNGIVNSAEHNLLYDKYGIEPPRSGKSFGSLILLVLAKLNYRGKAVLTVSENFLYRKGKDKEIREILLGHDICMSSNKFGHLYSKTKLVSGL